MGWTSGQHEEQLQSIHRQRELKGFLTRPFAKRAGELLYLIKNQLRIMTDLLTALSFKGTSVSAGTGRQL
jgi:hypothetical protein